MKAEGMLAGNCDLWIMRPKWNSVQELFGVKHYALGIEMKTAKGKLSESQKEIHAKLQDAGYAVKVCRSFEEFEKTVNEYMK